MVNGLHNVLSFAWCVVLDLFLDLFNNHGSAKIVICPTVCIVLSVFHVLSVTNHPMIPCATLISNSLYQLYLFVLLVSLFL